MTLAMPGAADGGLERQQLLVAELARADVSRAPGSARPRRVRGRRGAWPSRRRPSRDPCPGARGRRPTAQDGREVRVLAVRLLDAAPARVAADVEDRRQRRRSPPIASIRRRIAVAIASTSSGSNAAAAPDRLLVEWRASRASRPWSVSSWRSAGIPSRVSSTRKRWIALPAAAAARRFEVRGARDPADLADAVGEPLADALRDRARPRSGTARTTRSSRAGRASRRASSGRAGRRRARRPAALASR